ncbi:agglutinin-like protein 5 [Sphaeramia orbicularis]|uniref:Agglutinin-like protein 5 n=1 Tax=Sphaeramia orbicularis TaxID=375764 RepID=A0A672ZGX8_9TELE|nr:agglutinin-like protein 5 [Sphaeramia orbicularis]XP_029989402.1 agglutinin-like protein 5 [Sphaeramia orbicularis]
MDTIFFTLSCWLLALSFAVSPTEKPTTQGLTETNTITDVSSNSSVPVTVITTPTKDTTTLTSTSDSHTFTKNTSTTAKTTEHLEPFQSTTTESSITNSSSVTATETETPGTQTSPLTLLTTPTALTTTGYISSSDTTVITTVNSSTINITSQSVHTTTHGLGLNTAERSLTIVFCSILGVCVVVLVLFMFHRCKHKLQYMHQPLNNTDSTGGAFTTDDDTLVISGGLYDGHPIYDNVPTPRTDESQFRLEFLH